MGSQHDQVLWEIERLGGRITTNELMNLQPRVSQYQRVLLQLRERLALKGIVLTEGMPIEGQKKNFLYKIIKQNQQLEMFAA